MSCSQTFSPKFLRYQDGNWQGYQFNDEYINTSSKPHKITALGRNYLAELLDFNLSGGTGGGPSVYG